MDNGSINWPAIGWGIRVKTAHELFRLISHIALLERSRIYAWRGQQNAAWNFDSSLYRKLYAREGEVNEKSLRKEEKKILKMARKWGLGRDLGVSATDMHMLAYLQHHGVPTRLMDVTANPMTALFFAIQQNHGTVCPDASGTDDARWTDGVLFAVDVTETKWHETFEHSRLVEQGNDTRPLTAPWEAALAESKKDRFFRAFSALPDERMTAQEGFFLGSIAPVKQAVIGVRGINLTRGMAPGEDQLRSLLEQDTPGTGRPVRVPFVAIVIPPKVKDEIRKPLERTYNRRARVMFPDVEGFREALAENQVD